MNGAPRSEENTKPIKISVLLRGMPEPQMELYFWRERRIKRVMTVTGQNYQPLEVLQALAQLIQRSVGITVVTVLDLRALAEKRIRLIKNKIAPETSASSDRRPRFFSVSPMYLLTTLPRSIRALPRAPR